VFFALGVDRRGGWGESGGCGLRVGELGTGGAWWEEVGDGGRRWEKVGMAVGVFRKGVGCATAGRRSGGGGSVGERICGEGWGEAVGEGVVSVGGVCDVQTSIRASGCKSAPTARPRRGFAH
jgi:hypothetical protein